MRASLDTNEKLKELSVYSVFVENCRENKNLYQAGDLGEVYAISLAQTLGAYSLVTDDTKPGGPYVSLLNFHDDIMPFTFVDVLILRYLFGFSEAEQLIYDFNLINEKSDLNWSLKSQLGKFVRRFFKEPYRDEDTEWIKGLAKKYGIVIKVKLERLRRLISNGR